MPMESKRWLRCSRANSTALASTSGGGWFDILRCDGPARGSFERGNIARLFPERKGLTAREVLIWIFFEAVASHSGTVASRAASPTFGENPWPAIVHPAGHAFFRGRPRGLPLLF